MPDEDVFREALPYYLSIGMTDDQYWERDPYLVQDYYKAHLLAVEQRNQEMYMQGLYNFKAFKAVIENFNYGLGGKKGKRPEGYFTEPIRITPLTESEKRIKAEKDRKKLISSLTAWEKTWNKQHGKEGAHGGNDRQS